MPKIEVSNGELLDKYAILYIKSKRISDKDKLVNIQNEILALDYHVDMTMSDCQHDAQLDILYSQLVSTNERLWDVEDILRTYERTGFDGKDDMGDFIRQARNVYKLNDERSKIKKEINILTGSKLVEEKSYEEY